MRKKFISFVLVVMSVCLLSTSSVSVFAKEYKSTIYYVHNVRNCENDLSFNFDFDKLVKLDNKVYSKDLAVTCAVFSYLYVAFNGEKNASNPLRLGQEVGFTDNYFYDMYNGNFCCDTAKGDNVDKPTYGEDTDDVTSYYMGHKKSENENKEIIMISIGTTNGSHEEWSSNFDVGSDTQNYYDMTGNNHPDWKDKNNHKGFDVTATRVLEAFDSYVANCVAQNAEKYVIVTGHSRGAAIANLIGKELESNQKYKDYTPYTYTFAAPNCTTAENVGDYKTIFNIINKDDVVTVLPTPKMGFNRYGQTKEISVEYGKTASGGWLEKAVKRITGWWNYDDNKDVDKLIEIFDRVMAKNRDNMYKINYDSSVAVTFREATAKDAENKIQILENKRLLKYCNYKVKDRLFFGKNIYINPSPAYVMQIFANVAADGASTLEGDEFKLSGDYLIAELKFIKCFLGGMIDPHLMVTYYAIVKECNL